MDGENDSGVFRTYPAIYPENTANATMDLIQDS
jgi:hypothetical protein